jgi:uncharacterized tellurite resistance protein B-like protein
MRIIRDLLGISPEGEKSGGDTIRRIADELDRLEPDHAKYLASFAFILSRVANADHGVSADEVTAMEALVFNKGGLTADQAALVVQMARTQQKLFGATDDFLVTRELGRIASYEQKVALIDCLYAVASADERIFAAEADEISRIGRELKVDQADLSRLRSQYREFLEVRKGLTPGH